MRKKLCFQISIKGEFIPEYIKGRISGIIHGVICDAERKPYAIADMNEFVYFRFDCTQKQFENIEKLVTTQYSKMYEIYAVKL